MSKILHDVAAQIWAKAPYSLLIFIGNFVWQRWQEKRPEQRRKALRQKIGELGNYLSTVPAGSVEYDDAAQERDVARRELLGLVIHTAGRPPQNRQEIRDGVATVAEFLHQQDESGAPELRKEAEDALTLLRARLAETLAGKKDKPDGTSGTPAAPAPARISPRPWWRRALLLYSPAGAWGWITHSLFFMGLVIDAGLAVDVLSGDADDDNTTALIVWIVLTFLFRGLAVLSDQGIGSAAMPRRGPRSWLLLYRPRGIGAWIVQVLFYVTALIALIGIPASAGDGDTDVFSAIPVFAGILVVLRLIAVRLDAFARRNTMAAVSAAPTAGES